MNDSIDDPLHEELAEDNFTVDEDEENLGYDDYEEDDDGLKDFELPADDTAELLD